MSQPDQIITGVVNVVHYVPGEGQLRLDIQRTDGASRRDTRTVALEVGDAALFLCVDGVPLVDPTDPDSLTNNLGAVLVYLLGTPSTAQVLCRPDHQGSAVRAEFTTLLEGQPT